MHSMILESILMRSIGALKDLSVKTGIGGRPLFSVYPYMYTPAQLLFLADCLSATKDVPGTCVEAGCAYGATTVFLTKFMHEKGIQKRYVALDTFSGFVQEQAHFEVLERGKPRRITERRLAMFALNKRSWFDYTLSLEGAENVSSIETDLAHFDFSSIGPISFCLLDVDLYLPTKVALPKIYQSLSPGGIIVMDDCKEGLWDGSLQAYQEFCAANGIEQDVREGKLGVIRK